MRREACAGVARRRRRDMFPLNHFPRLKTASLRFPNLIFVEADRRLTAGILVLTEDYTLIPVSINENYCTERV